MDMIDARADIDPMRTPATNERQSVLPEGITRESIEETRQVFQPYYAEPLTDDHCIEMLQNVFHLFDVLFRDDENA